MCVSIPDSETNGKIELYDPAMNSSKEEIEKASISRKTYKPSRDFKRLFKQSCSLLFQKKFGYPPKTN
jgi:hypothetical protein